MDARRLQDRLDRYTWYHAIPVAEGVATRPTQPDFQRLWDFNIACMDAIAFQGKTVLDVGCRDGLFSFEAEKRGARDVLAVDSDLCPGVQAVLVPALHSKVRFLEATLYDLKPESQGRFDIVLCLGVLYHLRYPFWGLKCMADCLEDGGLLVVESGMLTEPALQRRDILYCPVDESPYEPTSCSFFNARGLCTTLASLNFDLQHCFTFSPRERSARRTLLRQCKQRIRRALGRRRPHLDSDRQFFVFQKNTALRETHSAHPAKRHLRHADIETYWNGLHHRHSRKA